MASHDDTPSVRGWARLRRTVVTFVVAVPLVGLGSCTAPDEPPPEQPALRLSTVHGAHHLRAGPRAAFESQVGDVLVDYVLGAFLGTYPRHDFVRGLGSFTKGAAQTATRDVDVVTAAKYAQATAVTATELTARLSFVVRHDVAIGATAHVLFRFTAEMPGGRTVPFTLRGRILLVHEGTTWFVFGYDLDRDDDGPAITAEVSP